VEQLAARRLDALQLAEVEPQLRLLVRRLAQLLERTRALRAKRAGERNGRRAAGPQRRVLLRRGRRIGPHRGGALQLDHEIKRALLEFLLAAELQQHVEHHQPHLQLPRAEILALQRLLESRVCLRGCPFAYRTPPPRSPAAPRDRFLDLDAQDRVDGLFAAFFFASAGFSGAFAAGAPAAGRMTEAETAVAGAGAGACCGEAAAAREPKSRPAGSATDAAGFGATEAGATEGGAIEGAEGADGATEGGDPDGGT
jgi:hypothetical protein